MKTRVVETGKSVHSVINHPPVVAPEVEEDVRTFEGSEEADLTKVAQVNIEDCLGIIAYLTAQITYGIKGVIPTKIASERYKKLVEENAAKPEGKRLESAPRVNSKGEVIKKGDKVGDVLVSDPYSQTNLHSLWPEEFQKITELGYVKVIFAESKPEAFVIQNLKKQAGNDTDDEALKINNKLQYSAAAFDFDNGIFLIKSKALINYMASVACPELKVYNINQKNPFDKEIGYVLVEEKESKKPNGKPTYFFNYVKREPNGMKRPVKTIYEFGIPYACNADKTDPKAPALITDEVIKNDKIVNKDQILKLDPDFNFKGVKIHYGDKISRTNTTLSSDEYKKLVESTLIQPGKTGKYPKKFEESRISPEMIKQYRKDTTSNSSTRKDYDTMYELSKQALLNITDSLS